jgi:hypothetical protein
MDPFSAVPALEADKNSLAGKWRRGKPHPAYWRYEPCAWPFGWVRELSAAATMAFGHVVARAAQTSRSRFAYL